MAHKPEIMNEIEGLSVHCRPPLMEANQRTSWLQDWCNDLAEYPIGAVRVACRKWRLSGATKFPTPGQLMPLVRENLPAEKREVVREWTPADEDTYRAMTVREKIREHQILAQQAYRKAGPIYRNTSGSGPISKASGVRLEPSQMSEAHRHWTAEGLRHTQEAQRLRQYLNSEPLKAATR